MWMIFLKLWIRLYIFCKNLVKNLKIERFLVYNDDFIKMCMKCALFLKTNVYIPVDNVNNSGDKVVITKRLWKKIL